MLEKITHVTFFLKAHLWFLSKLNICLSSDSGIIFPRIGTLEVEIYSAFEYTVSYLWMLFPCFCLENSYTCFNIKRQCPFLTSISCLVHLCYFLAQFQKPPSILRLKQRQGNTRRHGADESKPMWEQGDICEKELVTMAKANRRRVWR